MMINKAIWTIAAGIAATTLSGFAEEGATQEKSIEERLAALENGAEKSGWTEKIKIKGDIRARFEHVEKDAETSKSRFRGRARIGMYADVNDEVYAGVRIATGSDESPTSTNQSLEKFGNKREIWLDLMYMGYTPESVEGLDLVLGKIKQPWEQVSDLMYDSDVNPEGTNIGYEKALDALNLTGHLGYYVWEDKATGNAASDVTMGAAQVAAGSDLGDHLELTAGIGAFIYHNVKGTAFAEDSDGDPLPKGNTDDGVGNWLYDYELLEGFVKMDIKNDIAPLKLYGDYIVNVASDVQKDTAWLVGAGTKYKKFGLDYNYRNIEADAILGLLADGDFSGGGTGGKGHKIKAKYTLLKNWTAGLTYFRTENGDGTDVNTLQADLVVKF